MQQVLPHCCEGQNAHAAALPDPGCIPSNTLWSTCGCTRHLVQSDGWPCAVKLRAAHARTALLCPSVGLQRMQPWLRPHGAPRRHSVPAGAAARRHTHTPARTHAGVAGCAAMMMCTHHAPLRAHLPHAAQVQWLLLALCQDHPKNKLVDAFREKCYRAALDGKWVSGEGHALHPAQSACVTTSLHAGPCAIVVCFPLGEGLRVPAVPGEQAVSYLEHRLFKMAACAGGALPQPAPGPAQPAQQPDDGLLHVGPPAQPHLLHVGVQPAQPAHPAAR